LIQVVVLEPNKHLRSAGLAGQSEMKKNPKKRARVKKKSEAIAQKPNVTIRQVVSTSPAGLSLKERLQFLAKDSFIYGGAAALSKAIGLITFPLLARHLSTENYGVFDYLLVVSAFLSILIVFGQDSAVARYYYEHEHTTQRQQIISQSLAFQALVLMLSVPMLWFLAPELARLLRVKPEHVGLLRIVVLQVPLLVLLNFSQNLLKWTFQRAKFLMVSLGQTLIQTLLLLVLVLGFDPSLEHLLILNALCSLFFAALSLFFISPWLAWPKGFARLRQLLPYAIPYGVICVIGAFSPTLERSLTSSLLGTDQLGLYAVGAKIAMLLGLLVNAVQMAWGPFALSLYKQADAGRTYNWVLKLFVLLVSVAALVITLLAQPLIDLLASARYSGAVVVVFPLVMALAVQSSSWITEVGISISKRSNLNLPGQLLAIAIVMLGITVLTPRLGLLGVGYSVLLGAVVNALVASYLAQLAHPLPWRYAPALLILGITLGAGAVWTVLIWHNEVLWGRGVLCVSIALVVVVAWWKIFNQAERSQLLGLLKKKLHQFPTLG
jgi:O-antigen/teichoic acid export membrane protein